MHVARGIKIILACSEVLVLIQKGSLDKRKQSIFEKSTKLKRKKVCLNITLLCP